MTKSAAQLEAEIAESLRAKAWQEQVDREHRERQARLARTGQTPEQLYEEYQSDVAAGVHHGERRGRAKSFRTITSAADALAWSEAAKRKTDDAYSATEHNEAARAHKDAAKRHRSDLAGAEAAWLQDLA